MQEKLVFGLQILFVFLLIPNCFLTFWLSSSLQIRKKILIQKMGCYLTFYLLFALFASYFLLPLPFIYLFFALLSGVFFLCISKEGDKNCFLFELEVISFTITHLFLLGVISLVLDTGSYMVLNEPIPRILSFILAEMICLFCKLFFCKKETQQKLQNMMECKEEFKLLLHFGWFGIGYVFFDSITSMVPIFYSLTSWFLIGSSLLLFSQFCLFFNHIRAIACNIYLEKEHIRLITEKREKKLKAEWLKNVAYIDTLTGAYTRRYVMKYLNSMVQNEEVFSIAYMDLDQLKKINDEKGHQEGDNYLISFASEFQRQIRRTDIFARIGGDEFLLLMPNCVQTEAEKRIVELRKEMEQPKEKNLALSFSFGVTEFSQKKIKTPEELVAEADSAMYFDKQNRRTEKSVELK